ncbi:MAG: glutamate racemase [Beijerinckiaceae bacterium]
MTGLPTVLVFDSGVGGLTVYAELIKSLPAACYIYVADDAAFPYGRLAQDVLIARVNDVMGKLIARFQPDIVIIACNTASTICLPSLRSLFNIPFVGTVPAVKTAAQLSKTCTISVLGTPGTVSREYTHDLIIAHAADCRVNLVGAPNLARLAESFLRGETVLDADVLAEILPCFKERDGVRTDAIALACTHYPLLLDVYKRIAPWEVMWIDPAPAIAKRMISLLPSKNTASGDTASSGTAYFTAGNAAIPASLQKALAGYQLVIDQKTPFFASFV